MKKTLALVMFISLIIIGVIGIKSMNHIFEEDKKSLEYFIKITDISGLSIKSKILKNGYKIGYVKDIKDMGLYYRITASITDVAKIPEDSVAGYYKDSVLGENSINIRIGKSKNNHKEGAEIKFKKGKDLNEIIETASRVLDNIKKETSEDKLGSLIKKSIKTVEEYERVGKKVNLILKENKENIESIIVKTDRAVGEIGDAMVKINKYLKEIEESKLILSLSGAYYMSDEDVKTEFEVEYWPRKKSGYKIAISGYGDYSKYDELGLIKLPELHDEGVYRYDLQYVRKYGNMELSAGWYESVGGIGVVYNKPESDLRFKTKIYDINSVNDLRGINPNLDMSVEYRVLDAIILEVGVNNIINDDASNVYFKLGIKFDDTGIKNLIGLATNF